MRPASYRSAPFILVAAGLLSGCSHVEVAGVEHLNGQTLSGEGRTIAHLNASSWGIYLFNWIPIVSGSRTTPGHYTFFQDTATVEDTVALLTSKARDLGADRTTDLQSLTDSWWQQWSLIFWMRAAYASGNAIATGAPASSSP
ncbi:MAG: hypothetical protein JXP34_23110 [Planctomycetes bacterium]|nr:hypothetical protein [Planctomycetota bacterium]